MAPNRWLSERRARMTRGFEEWMKKQPDYVEVAAVTLGGATQGGAIGAMMGMITQMDPDTPNKVANAASPAQAAALAGGPMVQARNFAVMTGVNAGLSLAIKKARGGVEDVQGNMMAAFGSGAAFTVVSGMGGGPNLAMSAFSTGVVFALLQGAFYKIGKAFSPPIDDGKYAKTHALLTHMNLEKYERNFRKGQLNDDTLLLLTDSALSEVRIPPGPRLLILDQTAKLKAKSASQTARSSK